MNNSDVPLGWRDLIWKEPLGRVFQQRDDLLAFKAYVHERLDAAGVPKEFPDGEHSKRGCRIGDRLDWLTARAADASRVCDKPGCIATVIRRDDGSRICAAGHPSRYIERSDAKLACVELPDPVDTWCRAVEGGWHVAIRNEQDVAVAKFLRSLAAPKEPTS